MSILQNSNAIPTAGATDFYTHQIANSCRFVGSSNDDGTHYMYHTQGTPTNADKCTISAWVKRSKLGSKVLSFTGGGGPGPYSYYGFNSSNEFWHLQAGDQPRLESNALFRDTNAWYHIVIANDSTQGTASNRNKVYINGVQYTDWGDYSDYSTQNSDFAVNTSGVRLFVGSGGASATNSYYPFDGYIAEYVFIDGTQYAASDFGETKNGVWIPKDPSGLTFGNNGAYLKFESSSDLGNDSSGNNNDFTVTSVSSHDQMLDSPTNNFPTFNPLTFNAAAELPSTEGNCMVKGADAVAKSGNPEQGQLCNMGVRSGKWYWEVKLSGGGATTSGRGWSIGISSTSDINLSMVPSGGPRAGRYDNGYAYSGYSGTGIYHDNSITSYGSAPANNDIIGVALDLSSQGSGSLTFYKNGSSLGVAVNGSIADAQWIPFVGLQGGNPSGYNATVNFGQDGTFAGLETAQGNSDGNGYGNFYYSVPTGHLAMCTANLPVADAIDPAQTDEFYPQKLFSPLLYTGNGSSRSITGLGYQPDWVWLKNRDNNTGQKLFDSSRGVTKAMYSHNTDAEQTISGLSAFGSDGFSLGSTATGYNDNNEGFVAWNWRANGGTTSSNSDGSVTSTVQADPSGAFSIVTWAGSGGAATIGHGLSGAPSFMVAKSRTSSATVMDWVVFHKNMNNGAYPANESRMYLNSAGGYSTGALWQNDNNSSTVFGVTSNISNSSKNYVAYCFTDVEGYCKAAHYVGNGSTDGAFVYTGFKPAWVMTKMTDGGAEWTIFDTKRDTYNLSERILQADLADAERTDLDEIDILSNGFKCKYNGGRTNQSGKNYIYLAFASNPFKYATAR